MKKLGKVVEKHRKMCYINIYKYIYNYSGD